MPKFLAVLPVAVLSVAAFAQTPAPSGPLQFDFTTRAARAGVTHVAPGTPYTDAAGYGFESGKAGAGGSVYFSAKVPEGNYNVTVAFGDSNVATVTTLKAEAGRLMFERVPTPAGQVVERTFTTNVRTPHVTTLPLNATGRENVSLDQFDRSNSRDWDDRLTIEVVSPHAALRSIRIVPAPDAPTVFLAGDSTVTDRNGGNDVSWGQMLPRFLKPGVAVSNQAQSGETLKSFASALRLDKILIQMKRGDYLFLQFCHNDSKAEWPETYAEAETTYKAWLKVYIAEARRRGATPVLVTAMDRGDRRSGAPMHGHGKYPQAVREVAAEEHVALIDLYEMSIAFYESAGADAPHILADGTHSTAYGGYEFARGVATGIAQNKLGLAGSLTEDFRSFDPHHPDPAAVLDLAPLFNDAGPASNLVGNPGAGPL